MRHEAFAVGTEVQLSIPEAFVELFEHSRYKAFHGGRGSAKSHSFARALILRAFDNPLRVLCCREIQKSIRDSVKRLLDDVIAEFALTTEDGEPFYESTDTEIRGANGSLFTFAGLRVNPANVKSSEGLDIAWVAEANTVSKDSLEKLIPTLRNDDSEIWFEWNPEDPDDPVDAMFRGNNLDESQRSLWTPPPGAIVREVNWEQNPFFPEVLRTDLEYDARIDPDKYSHIWGGGYRRNSQARVFRNWTVEEFETPPDVRLYFGGDFGFNPDPACLVRSWLRDPKTLMVDWEAWGIGVEIDHLPALFAGSDVREPPRWKNPAGRYRGIPGALRWPIRADSSRPDTISYLSNRGFSIQGATKGPNSVEEGVEFLRSMTIVVHKRCPHVRDELSHYSYKVDKQTKEVLPILEDRGNHCIDSLRYSHEGTRRGQAGTSTVRGGY